MRKHAIYRHMLPPSKYIINVLEKAQPYSTLLLRCLQSPKKSNRTAVCATFPEPSQDEAREPPILPDSFTIGIFDRDSAPAVQSWVFTSLEIPKGAIPSPEETATIAEQLVGVFAAFRSCFPLSNENQQDIILTGSVHAHTARTLRESQLTSGVIRDDIHGPGGPFSKYIFKHNIPSRESIAGDIEQHNHGDSLLRDGGNDALPSSLEYSELKQSDYELIIANNEYVNSASVLDNIPAAVVARETASKEPVAWAFLGFDGNVRTLHVMPNWRRRGIGQKITKKLLEQTVNFTNADVDVLHDSDQLGRVEVVWGSTNIAPDNMPSISLFKSLGAEYAWDVFWARIDLARAQYLVENLDGP